VYLPKLGLHRRSAEAAAAAARHCKDDVATLTAQVRCDTAMTQVANLGISGGSSWGRYATPADDPLHDGTPYRGLRERASEYELARFRGCTTGAYLEGKSTVDA
jgi:hypothetical protein